MNRKEETAISRACGATGSCSPSDSRVCKPFKSKDFPTKSTSPSENPVSLIAPPQGKLKNIRLGMSRDDAHARLISMGSLEKEERKRQEVWVIRDSRVSHLLVGFDPNLRVRYVTAVARAGGQQIRYDELADVNTAQRTSNHGNYKFRWEVAARRGQPRYLMTAHGRDPQHLDSYSVKKLDE